MLGDVILGARREGNTFRHAATKSPAGPEPARIRIHKPTTQCETLNPAMQGLLVQTKIVARLASLKPPASWKQQPDLLDL